MRVGFIGLGSQGGPMARRIVEGGFELTLWARRAASLEPYADTAAKVAATPAELGAASDLVCLCVVGDDDVREVLSGENGVLAGMTTGGIIAIHSTVHPDTCREIAALAAAQGVSVIDAPVSGGGPAVEAGTLLVMVGGEEADVEKARPVFATYADPIVALGPLGSGQVAKILNNLLFTANLGSAMSALELGESLGVPRDRLCEVITRGSANSKALGSIAMFGGTLDNLAPIAGALLQKDCRHAATLADKVSAEEGAVFDAADAALTLMDHPPLMRIGFIGAGRMGAPMVRRMTDAGHVVHALGRTEEKRTALAGLGATGVAEVAAVADGADAVVLCVFTDAQVREIARPEWLAAIPAGATLIIHTTGSPRTAEHIAGQAPHIDVLDAPVSGGPHDIAAGQVTLFVGGSDAALTRVRPALASYADPILHVGPLGAGQKVKLLNNTMFAAQIGLLAGVADLAKSLGVQESALLGALPHGSGASRVGELVARAGSTAAFISAVGEFISKDVAVVRQTAAELGADLGMLNDVVEAGLPR